MKRTIALALLATVSVALAMLVPAGAAPRTHCFEQTSYCIASPILDYWERNGHRGLRSLHAGACA